MEIIKKMTYTQHAFPEFIGKTIQELYDFLFSSHEYKDRIVTIENVYQDILSRDIPKV